MSADEEIYLSTASRLLDKEPSSNTYIEEIGKPTPGPTFTRNDHGIPPCSTMFPATIPPVSVLVTREIIILTKDAREDSPEAGFDLIDESVINTMPKLNPPPTPTAPTTAPFSYAVSFYISKKGSNVYAT